MSRPVVYVTAESRWLFGETAALYLELFDRGQLRAPELVPEPAPAVDRTDLMARARAVLRGLR